MKLKLFIAFFFVFGLLSAQSPNQVLKRLQDKFNSLNNFSANFTQTFSSQKTDGGKSTGKFFYKKKNKFIVELKNQTIVSDGETIWNYDQRFKRVVISSLRDDPTSFSLEKFVFDYPPLCKVKLLKDEKLNTGEYLIELTPKDQDMQFKEVKIWINTENLISKMELLDLGDMIYSFLFNDIKLNQDMPDSKFIFYAPKGIHIIDLR